MALIGGSLHGRFFALTSLETRRIHVWDLGRVRAELAQLGLDWDRPPLPPLTNTPSAPLTVEIDYGDYGLDAPTQ